VFRFFSKLLVVVYYIHAYYLQTQGATFDVIDYWKTAGLYLLFSFFRTDHPCFVNFIFICEWWKSARIRIKLTSGFLKSYFFKKNFNRLLNNIVNVIWQFLAAGRYLLTVYTNNIVLTRFCGEVKYWTYQAFISHNYRTHYG